MLSNYILIAFRNFKNNPIYSFINVFGLTLGIVSSVTIFLFVQHEISYDEFHSKSDRIFRVATNSVLGETKFHGPVSMAPLGPTLQNDYPEVEAYVRINTDQQNRLFTYEDKRFFEDKIYFADSSYFKIFDFELISGDPSTCLSNPKSIVLTTSLAQKYFNTDDPLGKILKIGGEEIPHVVTGIMEDPIETSHLRPRALRSYASMAEHYTNSWGNISDYTYILLRPDVDADEFEDNFSDVFDKYVSPLFSQFNATTKFYLQTLEDIHLNSNLEGEIERPGSAQYLWTFSAIAFFLLLIACINYMNLATARSASRSREVGVRKAMGSYRQQLIYQFLTESVVVSIIALICSGLLTFFLIPYFNDFAKMNIPQSNMLNPSTFGMLMLIVLVVGLVGGSYPAFYLSGFNTVEVLKGRAIDQHGTDRLRRILVISQFTISMIMVICTWVVFDQMSFLRNKDLGFNKDQVLTVPLNGDKVQQKYSVLADELMKDPIIASVGSGNATPGTENYSMNGIKVETVEGDFVEAVFQEIRVNHEYLPTLEIPIIQGRNFKDHSAKDTTRSVIVNHELVKYMGWREPIGKRFQVFINEKLETKSIKVVGVVQNFNVRALQEPITPLVIHNSHDNKNMVVRLKEGEIKAGLEVLESTFKRVITNRPFTYSFLDQSFQRQYAADEKRGEIFALFALLTVAIACLGLFGLASFTAQERRKEFGIRKVMGAHATHIISMMTKELLKQVFVSMFIAFPIAFYFMDHWLDEFAFRIDMNWSSYFLSALLIMVIAFASILYQSLRSALANPVKSLREDG